MAGMYAMTKRCGTISYSQIDGVERLSRERGRSPYALHESTEEGRCPRNSLKKVMFSGYEYASFTTDNLQTRHP